MLKQSALPLLAPVVAAAYTAAHWADIPERFPIHWGLNGQPNHWLTRTPLHVFGIFIFAAGLCVWLAILSAMMYRGARPSQERVNTLRVALAAEWLVSILFSVVGMHVALHFPMWVLPVAMAPLGIIAFLVVWKAYSEPEPENQPLRAPATEPDLFIPKEFGYGYTLNFANPKAKGVMCWMVGGIAALIVFLFLANH